MKRRTKIHARKARRNTAELCPGQLLKGFKTMCGGQALIEGIMMQGPEKESSGPPP